MSLSKRGQSQGLDDSQVVLMSANSSWNIAHFRSGLIRGLMGEGYRVVVAAPVDEQSTRITELGAEFIPLPIDSSGISVLKDAQLFLRYRRILKERKPFAYLGFTAKPNIYGSLAARLAGTKVVNNITGLGTAFIKQSLLTTIVSELYRLALRRSSTVFFQNRTDLELFVGKGIVRRRQADLVPGDGLDLAEFQPQTRAGKPRTFRFLLIGRLLWDKGVGEYVEAARLVRQTYPQTSFQILGPADVDNRTAISADTIGRWLSEGIIDYLGESDDVRPAIAQADCIVLPSYREGLPRTLLEGSAMGKPLIATDVPGCRDVVIDGTTGYLCKARSTEALAKAMNMMLQLSPEERLRMGEQGRFHVEQNFSELFVITKYLKALSQE